MPPVTRTALVFVADSGLAVSVFSGERSAVTDDEVGSLFHELAKFADAFRRFQIVVHSCMYTGVAEVAVESAAVFKRVHQLAEIAQVRAQFFGSDG